MIPQRFFFERHMICIEPSVLSTNTIDSEIAEEKLNELILYVIKYIHCNKKNLTQTPLKT